MGTKEAWILGRPVRVRRCNRFLGNPKSNDDHDRHHDKAGHIGVSGNAALGAHLPVKYVSARFRSTLRKRSIPTRSGLDPRCTALFRMMRPNRHTAGSGTHTSTLPAGPYPRSTGPRKHTKLSWTQRVTEVSALSSSCRENGGRNGPTMSSPSTAPGRWGRVSIELSSPNVQQQEI
jgi:hypothetical protein